MTELATSSPPEPDWAALLKALRTFYADRTSPAVRDEAFHHVYEAVRFVARGVVGRKLSPSQGSVTDVSESVVDKVFLRKTFTDFALSFDPDHDASFRTWVTTVLDRKFIDWCRRYQSGPKFEPIADPDWEDAQAEWASVVKDIADCYFEGEPRPDVYGALVAKEDLREEHQRARDLHKALSSLPEEFEGVFLVQEEKETQEAAAKRLGISLSKYKRLRPLVVERLREALE